MADVLVDVFKVWLVQEVFIDVVSDIWLLIELSGAVDLRAKCLGWFTDVEEFCIILLGSDDSKIE